MFNELSKEELYNIDGGFVITAATVGIAAGCLSAGVATGYALGTIYKYWRDNVYWNL